MGEARRGLDALLAPRSVAVIGASDDPDRIGGRPLRYLREADFAGPVYPVNPRREVIQGLRAYPTVSAIGEPVDLAIVAVPASGVVATVAECAAVGVRSLVVFSAGFAEMGPRGRAEQARIRALARESGMRVVGPNCLGIYNAAIGFFATFSSTLEYGYPRAGPVALVSQSGAYASHVSLLATRRGIGIRYLVTTGNECDVELAECIEWAARDRDVAVIAAYAEGVRDGPALMRALAVAQAAGKPVVFMKVGRSEVGAGAARSHTDALAGADAAYEAVFRRYGVYRAADTEELLDVVYACGFGVYPASARVGLMTVSGGVGIQMADAAADLGLDVAPMPDAAQARLRAALPYASPVNPVDITAQVVNDAGLVETGLEAMLDEARYDSVVAFFTSIASVPALVEPVRAALGAARRRHPDRVLVLSMVGPPDTVAAYEAAGCLVFEDPTRAVRAVAALVRLARARQPGSRSTSAVPAPPVTLPAGPFDELAAQRLLADAGIPMVDCELATSPEESAAIAAGHAGPVALKVCSADIAHKTEAGGVMLDVPPERVAAAHRELVERVRSARPAARIEGVLVSPMIDGGVETILGVRWDATFGPVVMLGLGGILVELLDDVVLRPAPFDETEAHHMIAELRGHALLHGMRDRPPADVDALAHALARLSHFAASTAGAVESAEVNPFVVRPRGHGALGLDALVVPRHEPA